ncbi:hypothetical protein HEK131_19800 [Streptomyces seoulensis]|nr:hypothetical protein HEK131_19800 [Streptomyces seoulensis]
MVRPEVVITGVSVTVECRRGCAWHRCMGLHFRDAARFSRWRVNRGEQRVRERHGFRYAGVPEPAGPWLSLRGARLFGGAGAL